MTPEPQAVVIGRIWGHVREDAGSALRTLRKSPGFASVAILTLALGIGATTAIFAVVNSVLLKPLPFADAEELVGVWHTAPGLDLEEVTLSASMALTYRDENRVFEDMGFWSSLQVSVTELPVPEQLPAIAVSAGLFPVLSVQPLIGRGFTEEDDAPGSPPTVMLSRGYWERQLGADHSAIGRTLRVDGVQREIIGILPDVEPLAAPLYVPQQWNAANLASAWSYRAVGRLASGMTIEQAQVDVGRMVPMVPERFPRTITPAVVEMAQLGPSVRPMKHDFVGDIGDVLWVLLGAVGIVLLIACVNVANLFLVRADARHQEMAVRRALGAGQGRIARQLLLESLLLGLLGGLAGAGLAFAGTRLLTWMEPEGLPRLNEIALDTTALTFTLGVSILSSLLFGLMPVLGRQGLDVMGVLREGGRGETMTKRRHRARKTLVVAQMALALLLLAGSGLMIRSFQAMSRVDPGVGNPEEVLTFRLAIPATEIETGNETILAHEQVWRGLTEIPGVTSVGASTTMAMDGMGLASIMLIEDYVFRPGEVDPVRSFRWVTGDYFTTLQTPVLVGRAIEWSDVHDYARVAMVTASLAEEYWGSAAAALGQLVALGGYRGRRGHEIIGVVGETHDTGVDQNATPAVYFPLDTTDYVRRGVTFAMRVSGREPASILPEARAVVGSVSPNLPLAAVRTLDEIVGESMARTSFTLVMLAIAALVALTLGVVGLYGVMSYVVSQRTREIGIRMAVGADGREVRQMVLRQGLTLASIGVVIGLLAAVRLTRIMSTLLYGVEATDPVTFTAVAALLAAVALVASYLPALRASKADPLEALRGK